MSAQINTYPTLTLVHLYPSEMSLNGDAGNLLTLLRRMQWRNIPVELVRHQVGDPFPNKADLIIGGGGQLIGPSPVQKDLLRNKDHLQTCIEEGVAALLVYGSYQLFGNYLSTASNETIEGLGIFDMYTVVGEQRFTGNVIALSERFGTIVGFENHSGKTYLAKEQSPLALVKQGAGNNDADKTEGVHHRCAIGTYLFGPLLPKNPAIADYLIAKALEHRLGVPIDPQELALLPEVDEFAAHAVAIAQRRPR